MESQDGMSSAKTHGDEYSEKGKWVSTKKATNSYYLASAQLQKHAECMYYGERKYMLPREVRTSPVFKGVSPTAELEVFSRVRLRSFCSCVEGSTFNL